MEPGIDSWQTKLVTRIGKKFRHKKSLTQEAIKQDEEREVLRRQKRAEKFGHSQTLNGSSSNQKDVNELGEREYSIFSQASTLVNNKDHTDMMHGLAHHESFDSLVDQALVKDNLKDPGSDLLDADALELVSRLMMLHARQFAALPAEVWKRIASLLSLADAASLTVSLRTLYHKIGFEPLTVLNRPENNHDRIIFLNYLDRSVPQHLLCFPCAQFHRRSQAGSESLKADYVGNPIFSCPKARDAVLPRMRLTHGRQLPYGFVQLTMRGHNHSSTHGVRPESLSRRWKCKDSSWSHRTRYLIHDGHLLVRVVSQAVTLPAADMTETRERHLLYDREEYTPYFSVCAHWKDGDLMRICKCALSHVPSPPESYAQQLKKAPRLSQSAANPSFLVRGCKTCRPARRCPECPTEYLVEIQMVEDNKDRLRPFKHALVVTRWSDLGDGTSPHTSSEWVAANGTDTRTSVESYDSFGHVGRRALSGIFESRVSGSVPGQYMMSLNPKNKKLGEEGHDWY